MLADKERRRGGQAAFDDDDARFLVSLSGLCGLAVDNRRHLERLTRERERLEEENRRLLDETGRRPVPPAPSYEQVIHGRPWRLLSDAELIYLPRNRRPHKAYGLSPVEQIVLTVNIGLRRQVGNCNTLLKVMSRLG